MRKFLVVLVLILALAGFYVAWPAYSGMQIKQALDARDADRLGRKIDFPSVRTSLLPTVTTEVEKRVEQALAELGPSAAMLGPRLRQEIAPRLAEGVVNAIVTPQSIIRLASEGGDIRAAVEKIVREQMPKAGMPGAGAGGLPTGLPGGLGGVIGGAGGTGGGLGGIDIGKIAGGIGGARPGGAAAPQQTSPLPTASAPAAQTTPPQSPGAANKPFGLANIKRFTPTGLAAFEVGVARDASAAEPDVTVGMAFSGGDWRIVSVRPRL